MKMRAFSYCLVSGILAGLVVSTLLTFLDWRLNPGGIFHGAAGTDWLVVLETAWSWFWPVSLLVFVLALPGVLIWLRRQRSA